MKKGDKVKVISGSYKGARGTLVSEWPEGIWAVQPNENADIRNFYEHELEVIDVKKVADEIMKKHHKLFERLAKYEKEHDK